MGLSISSGAAAAVVVAISVGALIEPSALAQVAKPVEQRQPTILNKTPEPKRLADGHLNLTGFWTRPGGLLDVYRGPSGVTPSATPAPGAQPPANSGGAVPDHAALKEPYKTQFATLQKNLAAGKVVDPVAICLPAGMPRMMGAVYGLEILQTPGQITMTSEWQAESRRIWLDEKTHPPLEDIDPTYGGHSIGHWEGDTLVVDTIGLRGDVPINQAGLPQSDKMHLVERFTIHDGRLVDEVTLDDPAAYEAPWKLTFTYRFRPDLKLEEYVCEENNRNVGVNGEANFGK